MNDWAEELNGVGTSSPSSSLQPNLFSWREPNEDVRTEEETSSAEDDNESTIQGQVNEGGDTATAGYEEEGGLEESFKSCQDFDNSTTLPFGETDSFNDTNKKSVKRRRKTSYSAVKSRRMKMEGKESVITITPAPQRNTRTGNRKRGDGTEKRLVVKPMKTRKKAKRKESRSGLERTVEKLTKQVEWLTEQVQQLKSQVAQEVVSSASGAVAAATNKRKRRKSSGIQRKRKTPGRSKELQVEENTASQPLIVDGDVPTAPDDEENARIEVNAEEVQTNAEPIADDDTRLTNSDLIVTPPAEIPQTSGGTTPIVTSEKKKRGRPRKSENAQEGTPRTAKKKARKSERGRLERSRTKMPSPPKDDDDCKRDMTNAVQEVITCVISRVTNASKIPVPVAVSQPKSKSVTRRRKKTSTKRSQQTSGNRSHPCNICSKRFTTVQSKCVHKSSVHDGKRWECRYCGKLYRYPGGCRNHIITVHCALPDETLNITNDSNGVQDESVSNQEYLGSPDITFVSASDNSQPEVSPSGSLSDCTPKTRSTEITRSSLLNNGLFVSTNSKMRTSNQARSASAFVATKPSLTCFVCGIKVDTNSGLIRHVKGSHPDHHTGMHYNNKKAEPEPQSVVSPLAVTMWTPKIYNFGGSISWMGAKKPELSDSEESLMPD